MTAKPPFRIALSAVLAVLLVGFVPVAIAAPLAGGHGGGGGGSPKGSCTAKAPGVVVDNTWMWGTPGSWGLPGQQLRYAVDVVNYDSGCGSSTFTVGVSAPSGFSVSPATSAITLKAASSGYAYTNITSPLGTAIGDYPIVVTVQRSASPGASATSWYKVYSSDTTAPTLYFPNPGDGTTISGRSYHFAVSSSDDHAVKSIDLYIDNAYKSTTICDNVAYSCDFGYDMSLSGANGAHVASFRSTDWMGNVGILNVGFTVG